MTDERAEMQQARAHGLRVRNETREARAQTVIGELGQQLYIRTEGDFIRVVVADEEGTSFSSMRLSPEAADRVIRILTQAATAARRIGAEETPS